MPNRRKPHRTNDLMGCNAVTQPTNRPQLRTITTAQPAPVIVQGMFKTVVVATAKMGKSFNKPAAINFLSKGGGLQNPTSELFEKKNQVGFPNLIKQVNEGFGVKAARKCLQDSLVEELGSPHGQVTDGILNEYLEKEQCKAAQKLGAGTKSASPLTIYNPGTRNPMQSDQNNREKELAVGKSLEADVTTVGGTWGDNCADLFGLPRAKYGAPNDQLEVAFTQSLAANNEGSKIYAHSRGNLTNELAAQENPSQRNVNFVGMGSPTGTQFGPNTTNLSTAIDPVTLFGPFVKSIIGGASVQNMKMSSVWH